MNHFGIRFDVSHAHTVMDVVEFIRALHKIRHIHISDTKDGKVHALMGQGELAFGPVLQALKQNTTALWSSRAGILRTRWKWCGNRPHF